MNKACGSDGLELATKTKGATTGDRIVSLYLLLRMVGWGGLVTWARSGFGDSERHP